jgi:ribosomal protein L40E
MSNNCKHRWEESSIVNKYLRSDMLIYVCRRCNATSLVHMTKAAA